MNEADRDLLKIFQTTLNRVETATHEQAVSFERMDGRVGRIEQRITGNGSGVGIDDRIGTLEERAANTEKYIADHRAETAAFRIETAAVKTALDKLLHRPRSVWILGKDVGLFLFAAITLGKLVGWW